MTIPPNDEVTGPMTHRLSVAWQDVLPMTNHRVSHAAMAYSPRQYVSLTAATPSLEFPHWVLTLAEDCRISTTDDLLNFFVIFTSYVISVFLP